MRNNYMISVYSFLMKQKFIEEKDSQTLWS